MKIWGLHTIFLADSVVITIKMLGKIKDERQFENESVLVWYGRVKVRTKDLSLHVSASSHGIKVDNVSNTVLLVFVKGLRNPNLMKVLLLQLSK